MYKVKNFIIQLKTLILYSLNINSVDTKHSYRNLQNGCRKTKRKIKKLEQFDDMFSTRHQLISRMQKDDGRNQRFFDRELFEVCQHAGYWPTPCRAHADPCSRYNER